MNVVKAAALLEAARAGDEARVRVMLPPAGVAEGDGPPGEADGLTPLMAAAAGGHEAVVELLLERGADPAQRDGQGRAAAAHARAAGHLDLADRLDIVVDQEKTMR
jgi:hypothetical protein